MGFRTTGIFSAGCQGPAVLKALENTSDEASECSQIGSVNGSFHTSTLTNPFSPQCVCVCVCVCVSVCVCVCVYERESMCCWVSLCA